MAKTVTVAVAALFSLVSISGSSDVFRLVGDSVQLHTQRPVPEFDDLFWVFDGSTNVLKYTPDSKKTKHYGSKDRVEFNEETYNLTLKNLQKTDSGLYVARASDLNVTVVAEYRLSVLDPVEAPDLTQQVNRTTCNITLTCRGHDVSVSSSCYNGTCEEKNETSPGGVILSLSVRGGSIICNHSNPASWKNKTLEMGELTRLCADGGGHSPWDDVIPPKPIWLYVLVSIILVVVIIFIISISVYVYRRRSPGNTQPEHTEYAEVEGPRPDSAEISTVYKTIEKVPQPTSTGESGQTRLDPENEKLISVENSGSNTYDTVPNQSHSLKPETVYATVTKPSKPVNPDSVDGTSLP